MASKKLVSSTKQSKIVKYKLEEMCVNLKMSGLSYQQIAEELSMSEKVPKDDRIDKFVVARFLEKLPEVTKQIAGDNRKRLISVVNSSMDVIHETGILFHKTKTLLEMMEEDAAQKDRMIDPYRYKALASEMRELLKQMTEIQKEINDYQNIRKFLEVIVSVLQEECPDQLPAIVEKLKLTKSAQWFAEIVGRKL